MANSSGECGLSRNGAYVIGGGAKLQQQTAVEIESQSALVCFTGRVRHLPI